jgi:nicotinate-nucleotide pyrophosphorylase (carboxylating)
VHGVRAARTARLTAGGAQADLPHDIAEQVARALLEDVGSGDVTAALIPAATQARAALLTRETMILCGSPWLKECFRQVDPAVVVRWHATEGSLVAANTSLCTLTGAARAILTGERTALNFLQTLSGTATLTRRYVDAVADTTCRILDTRKTLPGLRLAQKYAVRCGGGRNHRLGLHDMVLIKENHIVAAGSIGAAVEQARRQSPGIKVEVEVESLAEFRTALGAQPDFIMLDEFTQDDMRRAVQERNAAHSSARIEASGGVDLTTLRAVAETGVDFISVGSLTKHLHAIDLSLRFQIV